MALRYRTDPARVLHSLYLADDGQLEFAGQCGYGPEDSALVDVDQVWPLIFPMP
ncbi:MAG TPA: hypothetical protein VGO67_09560 [Verrucomicrobiae bacterium]